MFIREGTKVAVGDLLKGIIIQSGNDASVAVAEHIADQKVKPVQDQTKQVTEEAQKQYLDRLYSRMDEKHDGWREHFDAMDKLSKQLPMGKGMDEIKYMEILLREVTGCPKTKKKKNF